jgi:hypothetical protein
LAGWYNTAQRDRPKFPENDKTISTWINLSAVSKIVRHCAAFVV